MGDTVGVDVEGLHSTGTRMAGRGGAANTACSGIKSGFGELEGTVTHARIRSALTTYFDSFLLDGSTQLPTLVQDGGSNVAHVAVTARDSDNDAAQDVRTAATQTQGVGARINRAAV